jgi:hypothetical protein
VTYLITFACYGTHLPGDARGSHDHVRQGNRRFIAPSPSLVRFSQSQMKQSAYELSTSRARSVVRDAVIGVSRIRLWNLVALHVRATHVHGVVDADACPGRILNDWKSYATRALRAEGAEPPDRRVWGHSGHWREIRARDGVISAIRYVLECQGEPMEWYRSERW